MLFEVRMRGDGHLEFVIIFHKSKTQMSIRNKHLNHWVSPLLHKYFLKKRSCIKKCKYEIKTKHGKVKLINYNNFDLTHVHHINQ